LDRCKVFADRKLLALLKTPHRRNINAGSRPSGEWSEDDFDVLADSAVALFSAVS